MYNVCDAILKINPDAKVVCWEEDLDQITWGDTPVIPKADIQAKQAELKTAYNALDYSRKRKTAYDKLNQLELMSDDSINGTTTHKDAILKVKSDYPKP
jgi:hypothetical protein|tara:strand:+ start:540 stop:836 length:297 start_codon:yes stop_codon:yes gene_type:complete